MEFKKSLTMEATDILRIPREAAPIVAIIEEDQGSAVSHADEVAKTLPELN